MSRPKPTPHVFAPDPDTPGDGRGREVCRLCSLLGRPGDAHHTLPSVPEQAGHRERYEHDEED